MSDVKMQLGLSQPLRSLVRTKFNQAQTSKSLIFSDTQLSIIRNKNGAPFQFRYCPALAKKPVNNKENLPAPAPQRPKSDVAPPQKKFDPFENPSPDLLIASIPDARRHTHNLVLNKFPVIANHFILSTRDNKPQTNLLEEDDLYLTYQCIQAWHGTTDDSHELYAFFNSGEHSGASQPHRHLQLLPVEDMKTTGSDEWDILCKRMTTPLALTSSKPANEILPHPLLHDPSLPVFHLATPINPSLTPTDLHRRHTYLLESSTTLLSPEALKSASQFSQRISQLSSQPPSIANPSGKTYMSYNLALTSNIMAILPRRAEDAVISDLLGPEMERLGTVSINGTILAGTLMVKNEVEWDAVRNRPALLDELLMQVAFPMDWGVAGTVEESKI